jgi:hypothetical protein
MERKTHLNGNYHGGLELNSALMDGKLSPGREKELADLKEEIPTTMAYVNMVLKNRR